MKNPCTRPKSATTLGKLLLLFAMLLTLSQSSFAHQGNSGVSFDFNSPGQYNNIPYNLESPNWLNNFFPFAPFEVLQGGVGPAPGSGALDLRAGGNEQTSILLPLTYDFSANGAALTVSAMIKVKAPSSNARATHIGFITSTNLFRAGAGGINDTANHGFMTVILQSTAQPALDYELRYQTKTVAGTGAPNIIETNSPAGRTPAGSVTLTAGNWYKLVAKFVNTKGTTPNSYTIEASLQDMGANGTAPGAVVQSFPPATVTMNGADMTSATKLYFAIRGFENGGVDLWDNIYVHTASGPVTIAEHPQSQTVLNGRQGTFHVLVNGDGPYTYQWNRNGSPIAGANSWSYKIPPASADDNGATYTVTVAGPSNTVTSNPATLTVTPDRLAVVSAGSVDGCLIGVRFNQPVNQASAEYGPYYLINGVPATSAALHSDGMSVLVVPASPVSGSFTVTVQNVFALSGGPIGANNTATGRVEGLVGVDVNNASPRGTNYSFAPGQFEITGGGADIWGNADQFRFVYTEKTGDFDIKTKIPFVDVVRAPTKAGLEVRASLDPTAPQVLAAINPPPPGRHQTEGTVRMGYNIATVAWGNATAYPVGSFWMRLRRTGDTFSRYISTDGATWTLDGQTNNSAIPQTALVGLAVCSVANGEPARAIFQDYGPFGGYPGSSITITSQPPVRSSVNAGSAATVSVGISATGVPADEIQIIWQRFSASGWTNLPGTGGTGRTLTTAPLYAADHESQYRAIIRAPGAPEVISNVSTVEVNDTAAPTFSAASLPANLSSYSISVTFSEPVTAATAGNAANYSVMTTNVPAVDMGVVSATVLNSRTVVLQTSKFLEAGTYKITINGVQDLQGNTIAANATRNVTQGATPPPIGPVVIELIGGNNGGDQAAMGAYTNNTKFTGRNPDFIFYNTLFGHNPRTTGTGGFGDTGWNNYGARVYSYFVPPTTGAYKFYMRSDDAARLFMNTNAANSTDPAGKVQLGALNAATTTPTLMSENVPLTGGQAYFLEALVKEGTGGDGVQVAAVAQSAAAPNEATSIPAAQLRFPAAEAFRTPVVVDIYRGLSGAGIADLNNAVAVAGLPSNVAYEKDFSVNLNMANSGVDNYLGRMYSHFIPPADGQYRIWMRSDDASQFFMNTNAVNSTDPNGKTLLGQLNAFTSAFTQVAQNVSLKAGQRYYVEGIFKEGGGGDGMAVVFRPQDDAGAPVINVDVQPGDQFEFPISTGATGPAGFAGIAPATPTVADGQPLTLRGQFVVGGAPVNFTWLKNGQPVAFGSPTLTTQPLSTNDNGAVFTLIVENALGSSSRSVTVNVTPDTAAPTLTSAVATHLNVVQLTFSEALDRESANCAANYQIKDLGVLWVQFDEVARNRVNVYTTPQNPGTTYTVTVSNVEDASVSGNKVASTSRTFSGWVSGGRGLFVEFFNAISGGAVANLTNDVKYLNNAPDFTGYIPGFAFGTAPQTANTVHNFLTPGGRDNYGVRVSGYFLPPATGLYRFYVRSDDGSVLRMNTNGPASADIVEIARNNAANPSAYDNGAGLSGAGASKSPILALNSGTPYYIEGLMKEGTGGDYIMVAFRQVDPTTFADIGGLPPVTESASALYFIAPGDPMIARVMITDPPAAQINATENDWVTLSVGASVLPQTHANALSVQWQKLNTNTHSYVNIPAGTNTTLSFAAKMSDAGQYRVIVSIPGAEASVNTTLAVTEDTSGPQIASLNSLDGVTIGVRLDELATAASIKNGANWKVNGDTNIVSIKLWPDDTATSGRHVVLTLDSATTKTFTVTASGLQDLDTPPNTGSSTATGTSQNYDPEDVGAPVVAGSSISFAPNEMEVIAGGTDIWGNSDIGHLTLTPRTGDFDIHLRVNRLDRAGADPIAKAGLMVRESMAANSRTLYVAGNPTTATGGRDLGEAGQRTATAGATALWPGSTSWTPVNIPNFWVRIKRQGDTFTAFRSLDGENWVQFATTTVTLPRTVLVGPATTGHAAGTTFTTAEYRDIHIPEPPRITTQPANRALPMGAALTLSVTATNPPDGGPIRYQWFKDGTAIAGANSATLGIPSAKGSDSGVYHVEVGNDGGVTISSTALVEVANQNPAAGADSVNAGANTSSTISNAALLGNDRDADGGTLSLVAVSGTPPMTVATNFNEGVLAGAEIFGTTVWEASGGVDDSGVLRITANANNAAGSIILPELTPGKRVSAWTASFKLRIGMGSAEPADGFSFNFANDLPIGPTTPAAAENGGGTGFSFCVDNYRFAPYPGGGTANTSGLKVRYKNANIAGVQTATWNSTDYIPVIITVSSSGRALITINGTNAFDVQLPNYTASDGRFGAYARTGGQNEEHLIDDLRVSVLTETTEGGGTVALDGATGVKYTAATNFLGQDKFYYIVSDNQGGTGVGLVNVNVGTVTAGPAALAAGTGSGTGLRGEYWKRPPASILLDGNVNRANGIDRQIARFGQPSGTFSAQKLSYTGNDLTIVTNWLSTDGPSFSGSVSNLDDGAFRFSGFLNITNPMVVRIGTTSDDGSRIKIGGVDIINNDGSHGDATVDTNVNFTAAGLYPIEVTYWNGDWVDPANTANHGGANFHLRLNGATITGDQLGLFNATAPVIVVSDLAALRAPLGQTGGSLKGEFWQRAPASIQTSGAANRANGIDNQIKRFGMPTGRFSASKLSYTGNDLTPLTNWLSTDGVTYDGPAGNLDDGALKFSGYLNVTMPGTINIGTTSDDGSRISIAGVDIINNDGSHGDETRDTNVNFSVAGLYPIEITYFNGDWVDPANTANHGGANFHLRFNGAAATDSQKAILHPALITRVVETGGDNEATDTIHAQWTGNSFLTTVANEPLPNTTTGSVFTVRWFNNTTPAFVDRNHQYTNASGTLGIPSYLLGGEVIMSGNDNRDNTNYVLNVTVARPAQVYLLVDNRLGDPNSPNSDPPTFGPTKMKWVLDQGWQPVITGINRAGTNNVPDEIGIDESADGTINQWYSIYTKTFPAGTFQLKQADNAGQNMYGVVVTHGTVAEEVEITSIALSGGNVVIQWTGGGTLQGTPALQGAATVWTDIGTGGSATVPLTAGNRFFRVIVR